MTQKSTQTAFDSLMASVKDAVDHETDLIVEAATALAPYDVKPVSLRITPTPKGDGFTVYVGAQFHLPHSVLLSHPDIARRLRAAQDTMGFEDQTTMMAEIYLDAVAIARARSHGENCLCPLCGGV